LSSGVLVFSNEDTLSALVFGGEELGVLGALVFNGEEIGVLGALVFNGALENTGRALSVLVFIGALRFNGRKAALVFHGNEAGELVFIGSLKFNGREAVLVFNGQEAALVFDGEDFNGWENSITRYFFTRAVVGRASRKKRIDMGSDRARRAAHLRLCLRRNARLAPQGSEEERAGAPV
jgi:hypothetical protein